MRKVRARRRRAMNFSDESANALSLPRQEEVFPEPRGSRTDLLQGTNMVGHTFNQFFPWIIAEDGTGEETINHVGRHELFDYMSLSSTTPQSPIFCAVGKSHEQIASTAFSK